VERAELVEWEKAISNLLRVKKAIPPVKEPPAARQWHPSQLELAGGVIGILLVLGLGIWIGSSGLGSKSSDCQDNSNNQSSGETKEKIVEDDSQTNLPCVCYSCQLSSNSDNLLTPNIYPRGSGNQPEKVEKSSELISEENGSPKQDSKGSDAIPPSRNAGEAGGKELQRLFTELKQKISGVEWCKSNIAKSPITKDEMSFVCEMLKKLNRFEKVNDFIVEVQKNSVPVPLEWCQQFESKRTNFSAVFKKNQAEEVVKLLLDFIQQLNKETSCLKNTK